MGCEDVSAYAGYLVLGVRADFEDAGGRGIEARDGDVQAFRQCAVQVDDVQEHLVVRAAGCDIDAIGGGHGKSLLSKMMAEKPHDGADRQEVGDIVRPDGRRQHDGVVLPAVAHEIGQRRNLDDVAMAFQHVGATRVGDTRVPR